ncbi:hypothetical protein HGD89_04950 [Alteromonadaceae bacterium A_SAG6]|nr:hypothetical protein [Alteromonadaceae bacterium A_SAG6]NKX68641.1 hypothetical protein [Alteromonadaceae bacterium A_SAG7]
MTSDEAQKNDFYEVHIYIPEASNEDISKIPENNRGALKVKCEFMPIKNGKRWGNIIAGVKKSREDTEWQPTLLSADFLKHSRIDVNFFFGLWDFREQKCSLLTLIRLYLLRKLRLVYLEILFHKLKKFINKHRVYRKIRTPLRSKFEIYEALMSSDDFLRKGTFRKSELSKLIFGNHYVGKFEIYQKVSQSLDWILDSCVEDKEIQIVSPNQDHDPLYKMKGNGIHYFTLTKEKLANAENNRVIQQQQVRLQRWMAFLTFLLVIGTFLTAVDNIDDAKKYMVLLLTYCNQVISYIGAKL